MTDSKIVSNNAASSAVVEDISKMILDEFAGLEHKDLCSIEVFVKSFHTGRWKEQIDKSGIPRADILNNIQPKLVEMLDGYLTNIYNRQYKNVEVDQLWLYRDISFTHYKVHCLYDYAGCKFPDYKKFKCFNLMMKDLYPQFMRMIACGEVYDIWAMSEQAFYNFVYFVATKADEDTPDEVLHVMFVRAGNSFFIELCELGKVNIIKKTCELNLSRGLNNFSSCDCDLHSWNSKWPKHEDG